MLLSDVEPVQAVLNRPHGLLEGPRLGADGEAVYSDVIAGGVWGCSSDGVVREILPKRRGIGVSPDASTIYLSDYAQRTVLAVARDGGQTRTFCRSPRGSADGLALDCDGGLWVALGEGAGVARFHPDGQLDEVTTLPASFVSSLCFGGPDMRDVLITTADSHAQPELGGTLLRARSEIAGLAVTPVSV